MIIRPSADVFAMSKDNPSPFVYPLLCLDFGGFNNLRWMISVGGLIDLYLNHFTAVDEAFEAIPIEEREVKGLPDSHGNVCGEGSDWTSQATPLLQEMLVSLKELGLVPQRIYGYTGSFGPSHVLLSGALFRRLQAGDFMEPAKEVLPKLEPSIDVAQWIPVLLGDN